jgi:CO/xanthine dehydrogenase FAD-binding subunit
LKKDGTVCHVTKVGRKCVAAHSADTPPVLMTVDAVVTLRSARGARQIPVRDFYLADGIANTRLEPGELVTDVRVPLDDSRRRTGYAKLRLRQAIDFPLLTVAVAARLDDAGRVSGLRGVVSALGSRPREISGWGEIAEGRPLDDGVVDALAERAFQQCHPLENLIVDAAWRRAMVPVYVRRALAALRS